MTDNYVVRVALPSGGWWELETRPRWKHVRLWSNDCVLLIEQALASLTVAWSFEDEVTSKTVSNRDEDDQIAILEIFHREVVPRLEAASPRRMAEELFAGLMKGQMPPQFDETHIMASTGWSWQTLQETPADVVQKMSVYLAVTRTMQNRGSLDFPDTEDKHNDQ